MTVIAPEVKTQDTLQQEKVDINLSQQKPDTKVSQQSNAEILPKTTESVESPEDPNFKAFREARKADRQRRIDAEAIAQQKSAEAEALKAAMEAAFSKSPPGNFNYVTQQTYEQQEETEDERIEKKVNAAIAAREAAAAKQRAEREQQEYPQRLAQTYSDFHQTISQENLDYLDYHYPEISRPLQRHKDDFDKWSDIYKAVKKFVPNNSSSKKESAKADNNFNKPKSMSSTSITQPGESIGGARLTEDKRAENWARMQKILKGVS